MNSYPPFSKKRLLLHSELSFISLFDEFCYFPGNGVQLPTHWSPDWLEEKSPINQLCTVGDRTATMLTRRDVWCDLETKGGAVQGDRQGSRNGRRNQRPAEITRELNTMVLPPTCSQ